jgi:hypothetical protein
VFLKVSQRLSTWNAIMKKVYVRWRDFFDLRKLRLYR